MSGARSAGRRSRARAAPGPHQRELARSSTTRCTAVSHTVGRLGRMPRATTLCEGGMADSKRWSLGRRRKKRDPAQHSVQGYSRVLDATRCNMGQHDAMPHSTQCRATRECSASHSARGCTPGADPRGARRRTAGGPTYFRHRATAGITAMGKHAAAARRFGLWRRSTAAWHRVEQPVSRVPAQMWQGRAQ